MCYNTTAVFYFQDMKKALFLLLLFIWGFSAAANGARLERIRFGYYPEKIRVVFDLDGPFTHKADEAKERIVVHLLKTTAAADITNYVEMSDMIVRYLEISRNGEDLKISIPLAEPVPYSITTMSKPDRLVIDFDREFTNLVSGGTIIDGVETFKIAKGLKNGRVNANALKIDLKKAEVAPALGRKIRGGNPLESLISNLNPWKGEEEDRHFFRATVSAIAEEQGAVAAVNGTYFAYTGKPLGTLLIDKELISSPIYDRTALIIGDDNTAFIDNIMIECYFKSPSGIRYNITGVNQGRGSDSTIMYTPAWGALTGTTNDGLELSVSNSLVREIRPGNSPIPGDGYILSINGPAAQFISQDIKPGDKIETHIRIIPYSTSPKGITHLISGGPRLIKNGVVYISKFEEKFKPDIAQGRAARTAVGITKDKKLLLVTVDGLPRNKTSRDNKSSVGVTLEELAELLLGLGAVEAMNLDGGSSTTMWIDGRVVNQPVNGNQVRVSNALVVRPRF